MGVTNRAKNSSNSILFSYYGDLDYRVQHP